WSGRRHLHPGSAAQLLQRLVETDPLCAHHEVEQIAFSLAAEAVKETPLPVHMERGRLLIMEWTEPFELLATGGFQHYRFADHLSDVQQLPDPIFRAGTHDIQPQPSTGAVSSAAPG